MEPSRTEKQIIPLLWRLQHFNRKESKEWSSIRVRKKKISWRMYLKDWAFWLSIPKTNVLKEHKGNSYQHTVLKASRDSEPGTNRRVWGYSHLGTPAEVQFPPSTSPFNLGVLSWTHWNKHAMPGLSITSE